MKLHTLFSLLSFALICCVLSSCTKKETPADLTIKRPLIGSQFYYEYTSFDQNDAIISTTPDTFTVARDNVPFMGRFNLLFLLEHGQNSRGSLFLAYDSNGNVSYTTTDSRKWNTYPIGVKNKIVTRDSSVQDILGITATIHTTTIDSFESVSKETIGGKELDVINVLRTTIDSTAYPQPSQDSKPPVRRIYSEISFAPSLGIWTRVDVRQESVLPTPEDVHSTHFRLKMVGYKLAQGPAKQ